MQATKVNGLALISNLFRQTTLFPTLITKDGLLNLLARTLGEDGRKSTDVAINTIAVFFSLSNFRDLHYIFDDHAIVPMVVQRIDLEVKRTDIRTKEQRMPPSEIAAMVRAPTYAASSIVRGLTDQDACVALHVTFPPAQGIASRSCVC